VQQLDWDMSECHLISEREQLEFLAGEERGEGMMQFLDDKTFRPGLRMYERPNKKQGVDIR